MCLIHRKPNWSCDDNGRLQVPTFLSLKTPAARNPRFSERGIGTALVELQVGLQGPNAGYLLFGGAAAGNHGLKMVAAGVIQWMIFERKHACFKPPTITPNHVCLQPKTKIILVCASSTKEHHVSFRSTMNMIAPPPSHC